MTDTKRLITLNANLGRITSLSKDFLSIIDSKPMQDLKGKKQLDLVYMIYPDAVHHRFSHSIGTADLTEKLINSIAKRKLYAFKEEEKKTTITYALLHDVGHAPLCHGTEQILKFFGEPDHNTKTLEFIINNQDLIDEVKDVDVDLLISIAKEESTLVELVRNIIGADKLDYINRDAVFCGTNYLTNVDLIIDESCYDGEKYGVMHSACRPAADHLSNYVNMYLSVYLIKLANNIKALVRTGLHTLLTRKVLKAEEVWSMRDEELLHKFYEHEETREIYNCLTGRARLPNGRLGRRVPKTFLSVKNEDHSNNEVVDGKLIKVYELPKNELSAIVKKFEEIENIIQFEKKLSSELDCQIMVSEMPFIYRFLEENDINVYNRDNGNWTLLTDEMPYIKEQFRNHAERDYALRICTYPDKRECAFNKASVVFEALKELIN